MNKNKKLIAAIKEFKDEFKKQDKPITFEDVLEFNRVNNPELYQDYMKALRELEKGLDKKKK